jgi:hypothetical protein
MRIAAPLIVAVTGLVGMAAFAQDDDAGERTQLEQGFDILLVAMEHTAEIRRAAGRGCTLEGRDQAARAGSFKRALSVEQATAAGMRAFYDKVADHKEIPNFLWVEQARALRDWTKAYGDSLKSLARISQAQLPRIEAAGADRSSNDLLIQSFAADGTMLVGLAAINWRLAESDPPGMWWRRPDALVLRLEVQVARLDRAAASLAEPLPDC